MESLTFPRSELVVFEPTRAQHHDGAEELHYLHISLPREELLNQLSPACLINRIAVERGSRQGRHGRRGVAGTAAGTRTRPLLGERCVPRVRLIAVAAADWLTNFRPDDSAVTTTTSA